MARRFHQRTARNARILLPGELLDYLDGRDLELPPLPGDLPDPHRFVQGDVASWRGHERAHHRLLLAGPGPFRSRPEVAEVSIPVVGRDFDPFLTQWTQDVRGVRVVHHFAAEAKLSAWMHRRMDDWKHHSRREFDSSRAGALAAIGYRSRLLPALFPALRSGDPLLAADTAIALWNVRNR